MAMNEMGKREGDKGVGEFPREFADTKSEINYLVLANNHIDTIRNAALKDFYSLQALDCAGNNLKDLPNGFNTTNLPNLSGVEFSYNQFREFPDNVLNVGMGMYFARRLFLWGSDVCRRGSLHPWRMHM